MLGNVKIAYLLADVAIAVSGFTWYALTADAQVSELAKNGVLGLLLAIFIAQQWAREARLAREALNRESELHKEVHNLRAESAEERKAYQSKVYALLESHTKIAERTQHAIEANLEATRTFTALLKNRQPDDNCS